MVVNDLESGNTATKADNSQISSDDEFEKGVTVVATHPLYLAPADTSGISLISFQLTSTDNFSLWYRYMRIALLNWNKLGIVDSRWKKERFRKKYWCQWKRCNSIVLSWLMNAFAPKLISGIAYATNAHAIWMDLQERFDKVPPLSLLTIPSLRIFRMKLALVPSPGCHCVKSRDFIVHLRKQKFYQFLMGLNDSYSQARNQILMMKPVPSVNQAYVILVSDESQRAVATTSGILGPLPNVHDGHYEFTALYSSKLTGGQKFRKNYNVQFSQQESCSSSVANDAVVPPYSKKVFLPNGDVSYVKHIGTIVISNKSVIKNVLHIPQFKFNLMHISKDLFNGRVKAIGREDKGLYILPSWRSLTVNKHTIEALLSATQNKDMFTKRTPTNVDLKLWHKRLGHFDKQVKCVRTDNGAEFVNSVCNALFKNLGIIHQRTCVYTPQQNEVAERKYRHILKVCIALRKKPMFGHLRVLGCLCYAKIVNEIDKLHPKAIIAVHMGYSSSQKPASYAEAVKNPKWVGTIKSENDTLEDNHTWAVVTLHTGRKSIGYKWVYRIKYKAFGEIDRFKARLVAEDYSQREGINYQETFSSIVKMVTVRTILSIDVVQYWHIHQMDVSNAFLQGDLHDEIYMNLPQDFVSQGEQQSQHDHSLFIKGSGGDLVLILVYVDDIIITGSNLAVIKESKSALQQAFKMKDLGELRYFLRIKFSRSKQGILMHQRYYTLELISELGLGAAKPASTPLETNVRLTIKEFDDHLASPS
ncbi:uncharacterized protein LOC142175187 [Nicotiana tabacum]|uniref:Uncharacterized protein LOC142175187 n=1 Tax=Nicotiana tabacum TaxID=4097 RepID=A0AC58TKY1_TOBAC